MDACVYLMHLYDAFVSIVKSSFRLLVLKTSDKHEWRYCSQIIANGCSNFTSSNLRRAFMAVLRPLCSKSYTVASDLYIVNSPQSQTIIEGKYRLPSLRARQSGYTIIAVTSTSCKVLRSWVWRQSSHCLQCPSWRSRGWQSSAHWRMLSYCSPGHRLQSQ